MKVSSIYKKQSSFSRESSRHSELCQFFCFRALLGQLLMHNRIVHLQLCDITITQRLIRCNERNILRFLKWKLICQTESPGCNVAWSHALWDSALCHRTPLLRSDVQHRSHVRANESLTPSALTNPE